MRKKTWDQWFALAVFVLSAALLIGMFFKR
jgi:hypothetical protein